MPKYINEDGEPLPHYRDHVCVTREGSKRSRWFSTVVQAERYIERQRKRRGEAVSLDDYSINPDLHAITAYRKERSK